MAKMWLRSTSLMLRFFWAALMAVSIVASVFSQSPAPSPKTEANIDSLSPADLQAILPLLKSNFIHPQALSDVELNRATVVGLLTQLSHGVMLLPNRESPELAGP